MSNKLSIANVHEYSKADVERLKKEYEGTGIELVFFDVLGRDGKKSGVVDNTDHLIKTTKSLVESAKEKDPNIKLRVYIIQKYLHLTTPRGGDPVKQGVLSALKRGESFLYSSIKAIKDEDPNLFLVNYSYGREIPEDHWDLAEDTIDYLSLISEKTGVGIVTSAGNEDKRGLKDNIQGYPDNISVTIKNFPVILAQTNKQKERKLHPHNFPAIFSEQGFQDGSYGSSFSSPKIAGALAGVVSLSFKQGRPPKNLRDLGAKLIHQSLVEVSHNPKLRRDKKGLLEASKKVLSDMISRGSVEGLRSNRGMSFRRIGDASNVSIGSVFSMNNLQNKTIRP